ncbi:hypothetical protein OC842_006306 [Tilletia horrida]|uniref:Protein kinase domain-containing protein n=1 Tax=Tilletia horrida TaxID=155126 RepID=A0AAN6G676_9BASI|nr:hypothetical protein OC842_006306 [Tilletia horrida]
MVTDLCRGGELFDGLVEREAYNEVDARYIMRQIFSSVNVKYLHSQHIVRRDLKAENILLREKNSNDVVISDFGLSQVVTDDEAMLTACGPQYVSPELLLGKGYNSGTDIWSAGVISYYLLGGYTPFGRGKRRDSGEQLDETMRLIAAEDELKNPPRQRPASAHHHRQHGKPG